MRDVFIAVTAVAALGGLTPGAIAQSPEGLRSPGDFATIREDAARSRALFTEAAKVIMNPRCVNCHPAGDRPSQGDDQHVHVPPVTRGPAGDGVPGNSCSTCHTDRNVTLLVAAPSYQSIPGHVRWGLAPIEMAWAGKSMHDICEQLKDPRRNGGRDLALLHEHLAHDDLIAWGWNPGAGRAPVPGTQAQLGARSGLSLPRSCPDRQPDPGRS
jgi:hypothetical protein